ncbi:MAG: hypothetical protein K2G67_05275 [Muribaculaceae bacterium]|nr:hypothetical protein [Muribaculaceae bacterium]
MNLSNPLLWELSLNENNLEELDLSGLPSLIQAWLFGNNLRALNISGLNNLNILEISDNCFDFTTLPEVMTDMYMYAYGNQKNVVAALEGDKVDLSACGAEEYTWFDGSPVYDEEAGGMVWLSASQRH